jgi:hypothetical protein
MNGRSEGAAWMEQIQHAISGPTPAIIALGLSALLMLALLTLAARNRSLRLQLTGHGGIETGAPQTAGAPLANPGRETLRTPIDSILPRHPLAFYLLALVVSAAVWALGLALAPDKARFLQSPEWHIQPFYLAAHLIALRLFVQIVVRNYVAGAAHLDIPAEKVASGIRSVLGLPGILAAIVVAVPLCVLDYRYLLSDRYEMLGESQQLSAIDYAMWGIWCAEWLLNALIWVALAGFLALSYRALRTHRFRAPIATVVQEKLYRPFLQMSSQGASVVLGFALVTAIYIWSAGGSASDFIGLGVTGVLLVAGFVPSWLLLNAKVKRTVREEIEALRRNVPAPVMGEKVLGATASDGRQRSVEERLDEVVAMMRAWHLERLQLDLGRTEAQALAVRLAAPAATAGWQLYSNLQSVLGKAGGILGSVFSSVGKLLM